jgi:SAM-dependent methyltransferase
VIEPLKSVRILDFNLAANTAHFTAMLIMALAMPEHHEHRRRSHRPGTVDDRPDRRVLVARLASCEVIGPMTLHPFESCSQTSDHERGDMTNPQIDSQYSTGLSRRSIEHALIAGGKDLQSLQPADLAMLEDFHTMGRIATSQLVDLIGITPEDEVLDAGSGIGGTARYLASQCGCRATAVDLTEEYCETARWLNRLVGLDEVISVRQSDVTELPFGDGTFRVVFSQHVQMNVADKARLYTESRRVLADGGRLAMWDIASGERGELSYPLPWADTPDISHLVSSGRLRSIVESSGFAIEQWNDLTEQAAATMQALLSLPPQPLGLHAFVPDFVTKAKNLTVALSDGRLRVIQGIARAGATK